MATGDKLYIADKQTLDIVKQVVDSTKSVADETKSGVSSLLTRQPSYTISSLNKVYYTTHTIQGTVNLVNITTPGTLYMVFLEASAINMQTTLQIVVDGTTIYSYNHTSATSVQTGLITPSVVIGTQDNYAVLINGRAINATIVPLNRSFTTSGNYCVFSVKPIRWSTSLIVSGSVASTGVASASVYYELD